MGDCEMLDPDHLMRTKDSSLRAGSSRTAT
jgi:hypothetical protein